MYVPGATNPAGTFIDLPAYSTLNTIEWVNGTPWHLTDTADFLFDASPIANLAILNANTFPFMGQSTDQNGLPLVSAGSTDFGVDSYLTNDLGWNTPLATPSVNSQYPQKDLYIPEINHYSSMGNTDFVFVNWMLTWVRYSYINSEFFEYTGYYNEFANDPIQGEFSWHTANSIFYGFVDFVGEDSAQSFMSQNPQQWINTLPGVEAQQFSDAEENDYFNTIEYQRAESKFKVRLKASIVNAGHKDIWLQQTSEFILNAINNAENFISIRYGMRLSSDNAVEISLTKQVHIDPIFYSESGTQNFMFNQATQYVYDIYDNLDNVPQNLDVVLDFNSIAADMQAQYPGQKVEMFYEHVDLITTGPFSLVSEDQSYTVWEDVYGDVEKEFYWDGLETFFDEEISKGEFNVYVGGDFKGSYLEDAEHWNGEYITFETGMSKVEFTMAGKTWSSLSAPINELSSLNSSQYYFWLPHGLSQLAGFGSKRWTKMGVELRNETQGTTINVPITIDTWNTEGYQNANQFTAAAYLYPAATDGFAALGWQWRDDEPNESTTNDELDYHFIIPEGFAEDGDQIYIHIYSENEGNHSTVISGDNDPKGLLSCRKIGGELSCAQAVANSSFTSVTVAGMGYDTVYIYDELSPVNPYEGNLLLTNVLTYLLVENGVVHNYAQEPNSLIEENSQYWFSDTFDNPFGSTLPPITAQGAFSHNRIRLRGKRIKCEWTVNQIIGQESVDVEQIGYVPYTEDVSHILNTEVSIEELATINVSKENIDAVSQEGIPISALNDLIFTYQVKQKNSDTIFYEFERTIDLAPADNLNFSIWEEFNYKEMNTIIPIENFGITPGTEIEIIIKPESFRKFNNELDGWIRLTKTEFECAWQNNLYISNTELFATPTKSHYWLYGDFIINNQH